MDLYDIVCRLVGPIQPVGETTADTERLANIKQLTNLIDSLLFDIHSAANSVDRQEHSMKLIGKHAHEFLIEVKESISEDS